MHDRSLVRSARAWRIRSWTA